MRRGGMNVIAANAVIDVVLSACDIFQLMSLVWYSVLIDLKIEFQ